MNYKRVIAILLLFAMVLTAENVQKGCDKSSGTSSLEAKSAGTKLSRQMKTSKSAKKKENTSWLQRIRKIVRELNKE